MKIISFLSLRLVLFAYCLGTFGKKKNNLETNKIFKDFFFIIIIIML